MVLFAFEWMRLRGLDSCGSAAQLRKDLGEVAKEIHASRDKQRKLAEQVPPVTPPAADIFFHPLINNNASKKCLLIP